MAIVKEVNFSEGLGLDPDDLNEVQRFNRAYTNDILLRVKAVKDLAVMGASVDICYSLGLHGGIRESVTNMTTTNLAGTICQEIDTGAATGDAPKLLVYHLAAAELLTLHAAADPTNPRWDIVCVKLEEEVADSESRDFEDAATRALTSASFNMTRRVKITKQVVAGTPSATPVEAAVPAGFCKWAAVKIPAAHTGLLTAIAHFRDWRLPIGSVQVGHVPGNCMAHTYSGTPWLSTIISSAPDQVAFCPLPRDPAARVLRIWKQGTFSNGAYVAQQFFRYTMEYPGALVAAGPNIAGGPGIEAGNYYLSEAGRPNGDANYGPLWANGYEGGPFAATFSEQFCLAMAFKSNVTGDSVTQVAYAYSR